MSGSYLGADAQAFELVQPGEGALDDPTDLAQTGPVRDAAASDHRFDAAPAQQRAVLVVVVATIGGHAAWPVMGSASSAADVWDCFDQRQQLGDIVPPSRNCLGFSGTCG